MVHMKPQDPPILEYDSTRDAVKEPWRGVEQVADVPVHCILCFFQDVISHLRSLGVLRLIVNLRSEMGDNPVYAWEFPGKAIALVHPGVGAPLAAGTLEEMIALGCSRFVTCGGSGVLDRDIPMGRILVPISAIRDEGTSYHYLPPAREVAPTEAALAALEIVLQQVQAGGADEYQRVKTWSTDGVYRETRGKLERRKSEGCQCVEMEAAALFAVARFRKVELAAVLYAGDQLDGDTWDHRSWRGNWSVRERLVHLAAAACVAIDNPE